MTSNVSDLDTPRKIKGLAKSIETLKKLMKVKKDYLNNLSLFTEYRSINIECHEMREEIRNISLAIQNKTEILERLRKEV